ncbi:glutamate receptor ionotropic, kainate 2-like isoform X1 [Octopus vulgaris]|uniref:Glutamate receptor ionotropic, kainate 2-like isoform X1 n=1 Tax=Octopus vulgaris TaxID=6645 RepID=A0AA36BPQ9_OCTVU|nr:glutamate receptor ionotropic, kainate 2-like isoform X1 [Octopus vulgaris]
MSAIEKVNLKNEILPQTLLIYDVLKVQPQDSFQASNLVCKQLEKGIAAVFGPLSSSSAAHVQSICYALEIPHLQTRWDSRDIRDVDYFSINLYPHYLTLSRVFLDLVVHWNWKQFTILYETNDGLVRLQEVLNAASKYDFQITVRKLQLRDGKYISQLKEIQQHGETRIIVDCNNNTIYNLLKQALQVTMLSASYHFIFTTLDLTLIDLEEFKYGGANITAVRMIDSLRPFVSEVTQDWVMEEKRTGNSPIKGLKTEIPTETALMYDAVYLFAKALHQVAAARDINTMALSCTKQNTWNHGNSVLNYMKTVVFDGLSGRVMFDHKGERSDFSLNVLKLKDQGLTKIGTWDSTNGVNLTESKTETKHELQKKLANSTLRVVTKLELPYVGNKTAPDGTVEYEGFAIDLLNAIAEELHFNYTISIVKDGQYGGEDPVTGKWNGMVGELIERKAELAVAGMSITYKREKVIDFTKPFLNLGITILYKKPMKKPPKLFSFLSPLTSEVWVYIIAAYLVVSFMLYIIARLSPYEWYESGSDELDNQFTVLNSLWFTIGCLMQQGSEVAPRAVSTRIVSGIWWFFTLIMISSYTANLAAFLTIDRLDTTIESVEDLAKQTDVHYGTLEGGSSKQFFEDSDVPTYKKMANFMQSTTPSVYVSSSREAVQRVLKENYAYLGESTSIDYQVQRNCQLMQVGGLLDSKGYGIATPRGSPYRDMISEKILFLQERQEISKLYTKWWKEKAANKCDNESKGKQNANELGLQNVGGVFVVLMAGVVAGTIMAIFEFLWKSWRNSRIDKQPFCTEVSQELRVAITCLGSSRKNGKTKSDDARLDNHQLVPLTSGQNSFLTKDMNT